VCTHSQLVNGQLGLKKVDSDWQNDCYSLGVDYGVVSQNSPFVNPESPMT